MRVAVHAKVLSEQQPTGIGVYTYNVLKAISALDNKNQYTLYSNEPIVRKIEAGNFKEKILNFPKLWSYLRFPFEFTNNKYDLLFVPKETLPPIKRPKTVVTCFDLMGLMFANRIAMDGKIHFWFAVNYALKRADRILAISESTKQDILDACKISPDKVIVTPLGYDSHLYKPDSDEEAQFVLKKKYGIKERYIINTSSLLWYRKNLTTLIKAFHLSLSKSSVNYQLVITGKRGESYDEITALIDSLGLAKKVILTSYIPASDMPVLLNGAEALVFPSLHEGFGLPIVEAMACGCPVITSNVSSMPEVLGDAGILVDPHSVDEISNAITKVFFDPSLRERMSIKGLERAKMFSWERTARETLKVFESLE